MFSINFLLASLSLSRQGYVIFLNIDRMTLKPIEGKKKLEFFQIVMITIKTFNSFFLFFYCVIEDLFDH